jgi:flagellum-specific peptidoglycan hydrolase FlgJ
VRRPTFKRLLLVSVAATYGLALLAPAGAFAGPILNASKVSTTAVDTQAATPDIAASGDDSLAALTAPETATVTPEATAAPTETAVDPQLTAATVSTPPGLSHLPTWVQVSGASASLYAADATGDQVATKLSRNMFLRVITGGASRLQVQVYDESGTPGQTGWVTAEQVLPSAPGIDWLVAADATTLWSTSDGSATSVRNIARFSPLQKLDAPQLSRVQVNVYSSDFSKVVDTGWVDVSATGPALAPQVRVPGPSDRSLTARTAASADQVSFLNAAAIAARQSAAATGVPASVTVAQAILESDWGRSTLAQNANNYFGMKVMGTLGNDGLVWMPTSEYDDAGQLYQTTSAFRAYKSLTDSMLDHDRLLQLAARYSGAMSARSNPQQFAALIAQEGYSTDPAYADKLVALMDRYNLYQLDA